MTAVRAAGGRRFSHIIDARSGSPVEHSLLSVTVVAEDAAAAGAGGTALLCLGPLDAVDTAERENLAALLWIKADSARPSLVQSSAFQAAWASLLDVPDTR